MTGETTRSLSMLDEARYRPEARVLRLPAWREPPGEKPAVLIDRVNEWRPVHPVFIASLESLRDGGTFEDAVQRALPVRGELTETHIRILFRRWFWQLRNEGYLEIALPEPPEVFADRYRRVKELGRGGIGIAHLCLDERSGERVVVKHAWGYLSRIDKADRLMRAESAVLQAFDHPGIPRHLESFEQEGLLHVVRDFVDGESFGARVARSGPPAADERRALLREAAGIVAHMHERGYLFLDPTPSNFLTRPDGRVAVIDVGICREHKDGLALKQAQAGSRGYVGPEVVAHDGIGVWSDVFGLGCLHYYLAAGKPPGHTWTQAERADAAAKLDLPEDERALLLSCWRDDPGARPTLTDLLRGLGGAA